MSSYDSAEGFCIKPFKLLCPLRSRTKDRKTKTKLRPYSNHSNDRGLYIFNIARRGCGGSPTMVLSVRSSVHSFIRSHTRLFCGLLFVRSSVRLFVRSFVRSSVCRSAIDSPANPLAFGPACESFVPPCIASACRRVGLGRSSDRLSADRHLTRTR